MEHRFKPGSPKPPGSGIKKGQKQKKKIVRVTDFIRANNVNIAEEWYKAIMAIEEPEDKARALKDFYLFVEPPAKEAAESSDVEEPINNATILEIVNDK